MPTEIGTWWTAPTESENGRLIMVTGRKDIEKFRSNERYKIRIEITWKYSGGADGMPDKETSSLMEQAQDALQQALVKDPVAVLTGVYTGDDQRDWVFYAISTNIFGKKLNEALTPFPLLPLTVYAENDPGWEEYDEMAEAEIKID